MDLDGGVLGYGGGGRGDELLLGLGGEGVGRREDLDADGVRAGGERGVDRGARQLMEVEARVRVEEVVAGRALGGEQRVGEGFGERAVDLGREGPGGGGERRSWACGVS